MPGLHSPISGRIHGKGLPRFISLGICTCILDRCIIGYGRFFGPAEHIPVGNGQYANLDRGGDGQTKSAGDGSDTADNTGDN